ncbi:MAG TPA: hypothetical protein VF194_18365 [Ferrovibrio sp.]|jgi:hypothetical protein|uniref:hypothetical protein n=1 Tax=Ferrovibrio sp. TaxID=1917215 RepID=UPI002ED0C213
MVRFLIISLVLIPFAAAAQGQPAPRANANKNCFTKKEAEAESEVRTGIKIREILRRCALVDPAGQPALDEWYKFDQENAERLRNAVATRQQAIARLFPNRSQASQWDTDAVVATSKSVQVNEGVCQATYDIVDRLKKEKWTGFKYYADLENKLLVNEIPVCSR